MAPFLILPYKIFSTFLMFSFFVDIFKNARPLGNFAAVLLTYGASSLLHVSDLQY